MKKTGYFIFHSNLAFSVIPQSKREEVLSSSYHPLCEIIEKLRMPVGWEFTGRTLEEIEELDPSLLGRLKELVSRNLVEPIASGYVQAIFPIWPYELNVENLKDGISIIERIFKVKPRIAYLNELVFSKGIADIYCELGFDAIVAEWTNARKAAGFEKLDSLKPRRTNSLSNGVIDVVWAHSTLAQKFQRAVHERKINEFLTTAERMCPFGPLPLYSSDIEVIGYRPWQERPRPAEWSRVESLMAELLKAGFEIVAPSRVLDSYPEPTVIEFSSCDEPCPTKKQDKYNITRWAVSGRDDVRINAQTLRIWSLYRTAKAASPKFTRLDKVRKDLILLTGSDFRTHTSDDKHIEFRNTAGAVESSLRDELDNVTLELPSSPTTLTLLNPHEFKWSGVLRAKLLFPPKLMPDSIEARRDGKPARFHFSEINRYPDGSIRSATISLKLDLAPRERSAIGLRGTKAAAKTPSLEATVKTQSVQMKLLPDKGYTIESLSFANTGPLIGHIPHGYYDHPSFSYDYFCGHVVIWDRDGRQLTDLDDAALMKPPESSGDLFEETWVRCDLGVGDVVKIYRVYMDELLVEVEYRFSLGGLKPRAFRIGILNLLPEGFDELAIGCASVLGGADPEFFRLDRCFDHARPVNPSVTAQGGYTASEGWFGFFDSKKAISAIADRSEVFGIYLVRHLKPQPDKPPLVRAYYTVGENDETNEVLWRGHSRLKFFLTAHDANNWGRTRALARSLLHPIMAWQGTRRICP